MKKILLIVLVVGILWGQFKHKPSEESWTKEKEMALVEKHLFVSKRVLWKSSYDRR